MREPGVRVARTVLLVVAVVLVGYLALLARRPSARLPGSLRWFGEPAKWHTIVIVAGVIALLCVLTYRSRRNRSSATVPVVIVVGLIAASFVLAFSSFWSCLTPNHSTFFTPLFSTVTLLKGSVGDVSIEGKLCPSPAPAALDVARLAILAAIFISLVGVTTALFRSQSDRLRAGLAGSMAAVVDVDDDAQSMIAAIGHTMRRGSTVVLLTDSPDRPCIHESRTQGARVITVDFNRPETVGTQRLWRKLDRLYLLSADPPTNLSRLAVITDRLAAIGTKKRVPLIMRIDDPWLAEAWRAQQFGGSDDRWAADTVGKYEVTAQRLLGGILKTTSVQRVLVCGTSRLTLALCEDMARRHIEREFHSAASDSALPELLLIGSDADEFKKDHQLHQQRHGFGGRARWVEVLAEAPSLGLLERLVNQSEATESPATAVIFVDLNPSADQMTATRLAGRFPQMPIYAWDPDAHTTAETVPIVGNLRTYRLRLDLPDGQANDHFERAAKLIHERYSSGIPADELTPATVPWDQLSDFFKGSNRRQLQNALWMVEQIAGHTWNTWDSPPDSLSMSELMGLTPVEQLRLLGFTDDTIYEMARREFESWRRYYTDDGWTPGPVRDYEKKTHEKLVTWADTVADPQLRAAALRSLAGTLISLRQLSYRSRSAWDFYRRAETVTAKRHPTRWTWTTPSGKTATAAAGDWEVCGDSACWPVHNEVFHESYRHVGGRAWERTGVVLARSARAGEVLHSAEGPVTAVVGDWVLQGEGGELWRVSGAEFARRYRGPVQLREPHEYAKLFADDDAAGTGR